ncbi:MAG: hypothetical protein BWZ10_00915 [candidate division BRC1 bacterium ADurb.BinA364]|nr:MAG: hypothetical protein BWZ10_00915 [candidate division BRC1 bacterium ADurb.BinA364]
MEKRTEGILRLKASQPGAADYIDERDVPILPGTDRIRVEGPLALLDRSGQAADFLRKTGTAFESIDSLDELKGRAGLALIGPDSLTAAEAYGRGLLAFAAGGGKVVALEQEYPAAGGNLSAPLKTTTRQSGYAHPQALGAPIFRDLGADDLIDWAGGHPTVKNAYEKPQSGALSLVECGPLLPWSALVEMEAGQGVIVLCQLRVGANLGLDPAAEILLRNLLERYSAWTPERGKAAAYAPDNALLIRKIEETGALFERVDSIEAGLDVSKYKALIVDGAAGNLSRLNELKSQADAFQDAGNWIALCGVGPEGVEDFNRLAGAAHMMRPYRLERNHLQEPHPLAATLGDGDVMLYGAEWIAQWQGTRWVNGDTFSYVIDGIDAAPFTYPPGAKPDPYVYEPTRDDKDPYNFVNGLTRLEFWKYIAQIWVQDNPPPSPLVFRLRQPETIREIQIWNNDAYSTIEHLDVIFDGDEASARRMVLPDGPAMESMTLDPPRRVETSIALAIRSWRKKTGGRPQSANLVGIDNVRFLRAERPSHGVFLDRAGGLVAFDRGRGGLLLNQIKFLDEEPVAANAAKKTALLKTLLRNMGVGSRSAAVAVPGLNVRYRPIDITDWCNQYRAARGGVAGWFGSADDDLRALPGGEGRYGDVLYSIVDYATAPVPDCIVLGGLKRSPEGLASEAKGIPVKARADALFFLHAANVHRPISEDERGRVNDKKRPFILPEVARYRLHYADGQTADIPVILEKHVDHWLLSGREPAALEGADAAWSSSLGARGKNRIETKAVAYSMKVANPRPDVEIESIDFLPGLNAQNEPENRAVPALLAITLGEIVE